MANNYVQMTGVLVLDHATPVITGLFGPLNLDPSYPGEGRAYIADDDGVSWDSVMESLAAAGDAMGLPGHEDVLQRFADHFGLTDERVEELIAGIDADGTADIATLYDLAIAFDDGHGLTAIIAESAFTCDKARLHSFGGCGQFIGSHVSMLVESGDALRVGSPLQEALKTSNVDKAAEIIDRETQLLLQRISDPGTRRQVESALVRRISAGHSMSR